MTSIYIISKLPMFGEGIEKMLRTKKGVEILGFERDIARAIQQIIELKPEVVVFDCKEDQVEISSAIMQILEKGMKVKIVGLDIQTNTFFVDKQEQHEVKKWEDLLEEIE
jgi:DNA-binding NarL/FixJ family response regulator